MPDLSRQLDPLYWQRAMLQNQFAQGSPGGLLGQLADVVWWNVSYPMTDTASTITVGPYQPPPFAPSPDPDPDVVRWLKWRVREMCWTP